MLYDFLTRERQTILSTAKQKAMASRWARMTSEDIEEGWSVFYDELAGLLKKDEPAVEGKEAEVPNAPRAALQGRAYLKLGYAISEVVQSYGIIYQAITESAVALGFEITTEDFQRLNLSLDTAIADVVTEFESVQTEAQDTQNEAQEKKETERLGFLAHELRNSLQSATITLEMIEEGIVDVKSKTGKVLQTSLQRMALLIDTALTEVRLRVEPAVILRRVRLSGILSEVEVTAGFQARSRGLNLMMPRLSAMEVVVDRHLIVSAISNLVQNALKFSKPNGTIEVRARQEGERILIDIEDECGGLPEGKIEELFVSGVQKSADRTGLGLGLAISRQAIERNKGTLSVKDLPGKGCVFTIELPKASGN